MDEEIKSKIDERLVSNGLTRRNDIRKENIRENSTIKSENFPGVKKPEKVLKRIGDGKIKKKNILRRTTENFLEDTTQSVKTHIIHDVLIPAAKNLICDVIGWGGFAERLLWGTSRGRNTSNDRFGQSRVNYGGLSRLSNTNPSNAPRRLATSNRSRHDFGEIVLGSRGEAEEILSNLVDLTIDYGMATVADLYYMANVESEFTDNKYGWTDLGQAYVSRVQGGYLINLPRVQPLD